ANEFVQRHAGVMRQVERGAIGEGDADGAIGAGLDRVAPVDRITDFHTGNNAAGAHHGDGADHCLDPADCRGGRDPHHLGVAAHSAILTWRITGATEHAPPPCAMGCFAMSRSSRDSPDQSKTGINVRVFPALLQDRREVLTATSTSGNPNAWSRVLIWPFSLAFGRTPSVGCS